MLYTKEQFINGMVAYIDNEVIAKLPTSGKIIAGAAVALAMKGTLLNNASDIGQKLGVVNGDGMVDVDSLAECLRSSMQKYGVVQLNYPLIGQLTFTVEDIDLARRYIS